MGRKYGFSFSLKRALGISGAKNRISRKIGIPLTRSGRRRKVGRSAGCFIATATYGNENSSQVEFFRTFRDEVLLNSRLGRLLVQLYYKTSPYPAWLIIKMPILKNISRNILDKLSIFIETHTQIKKKSMISKKKRN